MQDMECETDTEPPDSWDNGLNTGISIGKHKNDGRAKRRYGNARRAKESEAQQLLLSSYCCSCPGSTPQPRQIIFSQLLCFV